MSSFIDKFLEDANSHKEQEDKELKVEKKSFLDLDNRDWIIALAIFVVVIGIRLFFLFRISDPQNAGDNWYDDTYHHWQVAYLTREIGLSRGFLRLWDLKGMEYFWGPLHPFLSIVMFGLTGTVSIVNIRLLSIIFGSLALAVLYLIIKKFWNFSVALSTVFLASIHPVSILNDASGMLEPIGFFLIFSGILILKSFPFLAGVLWGLAAMARAEDWLFGGLLLLLSFKVLKKPNQIPALFLGWGITILVYMKYLLDKTGNAIYPIWWNFLANARGVWAGEMPFKPYQLAVRPYLIAWFVIAVILFALIFIKGKTKGAIFLLFGFANWAFIGGFMGLTHYLKGFEPWFWYIRFFEFPYVFLGFLIALFLFYILPSRFGVIKKYSFILWGLILSLAAIYQVIFWPPIMKRYQETKSYWARTLRWADSVNIQYSSGKLLITENYPPLTYAIVMKGKIKGANLVSQMFDPFYYMSGDPFSRWGENRKAVLTWIKNENIRLILADATKERYKKLYEKEPDFFEYVGAVEGSPFVIYKVYPERIKAL